MLSAALILVFSSAATMQFAVFSWRAFLLQIISEQKECPNLLSSSSFHEILSVYQDLCPQIGARPSLNLRAVSIYYAGMQLMNRVGKAVMPSSTGWAKREMAICAQYATVVLSQQISSNMALADEARSF
jgi:hypothetical protein